MPTLLIVDDEANIRSSLQSALGREGYQVDTAETLAEGRSKLREAYDVVMLDVWLPDGSGLDALAEIRASAPETVVIVMSGHADVQTVTEAINQGAVYKFCTKPWDNDQLRSDVKEAFAYKLLQDENRRLTERVNALEANVLESGTRAA